MTTITPEQLGKLTDVEKLDLIEVLWNSIDANALPLYDWQKKELDQAIEEYRCNPEEGEDWEIVMARLKQAL